MLLACRCSIDLVLDVDVGMLGCWDVGMLGCWDVGMLGCWVCQEKEEKRPKSQKAKRKHLKETSEAEKTELEATSEAEKEPPKSKRKAKTVEKTLGKTVKAKEKKEIRKKIQDLHWSIRFLHISIGLVTILMGEFSLGCRILSMLTVIDLPTWHMPALAGTEIYVNNVSTLPGSYCSCKTWEDAKNPLRVTSAALNSSTWSTRFVLTSPDCTQPAVRSSAFRPLFLVRPLTVSSCAPGTWPHLRWFPNRSGMKLLSAPVLQRSPKHNTNASGWHP